MAFTVNPFMAYRPKKSRVEEVVLPTFDNLSDKQLKYCAQDVIYLHKIYESLKNILVRENRIDLYEKTIKFINTRVQLDLASFKEDIWSH